MASSVNGDALTVVTTALTGQCNSLLADAAELEKQVTNLQARIAAMLAQAKDNRAAAAQLSAAITSLTPTATQAQPVLGVPA